MREAKPKEVYGNRLLIREEDRARYTGLELPPIW